MEINEPLVKIFLAWEVYTFRDMGSMVANLEEFRHICGGLRVVLNKDPMQPIIISDIHNKNNGTKPHQNS